MELDRRMLRVSWDAWLSHDNSPRVGPWWLAWVWTLLFCAVLAAAFTVLGFFAFGREGGGWRGAADWLRWYGRNLVVTLTIGVLIHVMFDLARATVAPPERVLAWRGWQRTAFFAGVPMLGVAFGWPLGVALAGADVRAWLLRGDAFDAVAGSMALSLLITFVLHQFFSAKADRLEAERRATEAQLRLLQAQMEPHFLFNTLANVASLIDHEPAKARAMLGAFTDYLRASLRGLRRDEGTLADELALAEAYLRVQQGRMEARLAWRIEADDTLGRAALPPLLLQPLVENAVHHGLEPTIAGGTVSVSARARDGRLEIEVRDDGRGLGAPSRRGAGVALANIRQRLFARFGTEAALDLAPAEPGTRARLVLPLRFAPEEP
jgi:signal transduction histidine kinase